MERLANQADFPWKVFDGTLPVVIHPNDAVTVTLFELDGLSTPPSMELRIRGRDDLLRVPLRGHS